MTISSIIGSVKNLVELVNYQDGAIVSKEIIKNDSGTVTLFAFDKGQGLSEHTAPCRNYDCREAPCSGDRTDYYYACQ